MATPNTVPLLSGNLASSRRTITGVMGQLALAGLDDARRLAILGQIGLPPEAVEDPEFPISTAQELQALAALVRELQRSKRDVTGYAIETFSGIGINHYGVLGLAMQHATTTLEAIEFFLAHPELSWGHSRILVRREDGRLTFEFDMVMDRVMDMAIDRDAGGDTYGPSEVDEAQALRAYCITRDLVSVDRLIGDLIGRSLRPLAVTLPSPEPPAPFDATAWLRCPTTFAAAAASLHYPSALANSVPIHASAPAFRRYATLTRRFSRVLTDDASLREQVTRLLWAYTPPPDREQVASMLAMSARSLARKLAAEGTSFNALLRRVQRERAMSFLRHTRKPLSLIAEHMGYSDAAAFTRAFQSWTGMAPSQWRRRARTTS